MGPPGTTGCVSGSARAARNGVDHRAWQVIGACGDHERSPGATVLVELGRCAGAAMLVVSRQSEVPHWMGESSDHA